MDYAKDDVRFCYQAGLLNGRGEGFEPQGSATRAEACTILLRLDRYLTEHPPVTEEPPEEATVLIFTDPTFRPDEAAE